MAYLIYERASGEIRSTAQNMITSAMLPDGFAVREYNGDLTKIRERRVTKSGQVVKKGAAHSAKEATDRAWKALRRRRTLLLERSDWTQVPDSPADKSAWREYRQALRDLTSTTTDPTNVKWPEAPE